MISNRDDLDIELIRSAQSAGKENQSKLVEWVEPKVYTYIYRMTLNDQLSEDLCQETLLMLIKSLPKLEIQHVNQFWGWLYKTALTRVQRYFRVHGNQHIRLKMIGDDDFLLQTSDEKLSALHLLMRSEAYKATIHALFELKLKYRSVLTLRCLDQLSYSEIAVIMGGSEMQVRLWFFRAKRSLRRKLEKKGFTKDCLLPALGVFAYLTASESQKASAAAALTVESLNTGKTVAFLGILTSKGALVSMCVVLGIVLMIIVGQHTVPDSSGNLSPQVIPPIPQLDNDMQRIYDYIPTPSEYTFITQISNTYDPSGSGWQYAPFNWPNIGAPQSIESLTEHPPGLLILRPGNWVEYSLNGLLKEHARVEIALGMLNWGECPNVYITDGAQQQQQIFITAFSNTLAPGYHKIIGFDLSPFNNPFEIRGIRIEGIDNIGPFGGCLISRPAAYVEVADPCTP